MGIRGHQRIAQAVAIAVAAQSWHGREMSKPILIKPNIMLFRKIERAAKLEKRKPGPMVVILLERYFAASKKEKAAKKAAAPRKRKSKDNGHAAPPAGNHDLTDNDIPKGENDASL